MKLYSRFKNFVFPALLVAVAITLSAVNYTPGTFLSGWDTLHPEFNLPLYLSRIFWGVWQQHQGLGAVAAQAHASELGRLWYLLPASLLPVDLFRYGYFWLMLILGSLGIYFLLNKVVRSQAAFLGGLFYLLNLGTLQHFYLPLEMFATAYGFLPWLFWAVYQKREWPLALLFLVSAPMAHTPTLWFVNFAALAIFALVLNWRWAIKVVLIGLLVNSFWLLPSVYFVINHGVDVASSHINEQFSIRAILTNKEFGNLWDVAILRGYLFDWGHFDFGLRQYADLFPLWKSHLSNLAVLVVGYGAFVGVVLGVGRAFWKRISLGKALLPVLLVSFLGMLTVFDFLGNFNPVLAGAFRFPFTKFSLLLMLCFSVYFALALEKVGKAWLLVAITLVFYMWPAFRGDLICRCEEVRFPESYREAFSWFAKQDSNTRIAPFPVNSIYGWGYYDWGYEGAGFRWFGLPQPILDREFDRWMPTNEGYYWELSYALYSKNLSLLEAVLEKYRVNWLLVDQSMVNPPSPKALFVDELIELIARSGKIKPAAKFGNLAVYQVSLSRATKNFASVATDLPGVQPAYKWSNVDRAFVDLGDYLLGTDYPYPNRTLFTGKKPEDLEFDPKKLATLPPLLGVGRKTWPATGQCVSSTPQGQEGCVTMDFPNLPHQFGYLITVESQNQSGQPLLFFVENTNNRTIDMETYLPKRPELVTSYFVQPPMEADGIGYKLHFDSVSFGKEKSANYLGVVTVTMVDYWGLVGQRVGQKMVVPKYLPTEGFQVDHPNTSFYRLDLGKGALSKGSTLILSQSYEPGWWAFGVGSEGDITPLSGHVLVDNWANGWKLSGNERIVYVFFWPQLLEFAGFGLWGLFGTFLLTKRVRRKIIALD